eukprot:m.6281 g.6281  ORF g.6281 m.6281 type:complete len:485 (+) comp5143_c0_seq1:357-1811(+)
MSHNLFAALAELKSSAPEDVDPEMEGFGESWVPTDRSNTPHKRTPRIAENPRYRAQTVSRADLAGASDDSSDSESDEQEQDDDAAAQEQASDADDADSDSDSDGGSAASSEEEDNDVAYDTSATDKMKSELAALQQTEAAAVKRLSTDHSAQVSKGKHAKNQLTLWDSLLQARVASQRLLSACNQLPETDKFNTVCSSVQPVLADAFSALASAFVPLVEDHAQLAGRNKATADTVPSKAHFKTLKRCVQTLADGEGSTKPTKRAKAVDHMLDAMDQYAEEQLSLLKPFVTKTVDKWNTKTRVTGGKSGKSFRALDRPVVKQIDEIMDNPQRLIKRTQLNRQQVAVIGRELASATPGQQAPESTTTDEQVVGNSATPSASALSDDDHCAAIFDDSDFYQELLREMLERKTNVDAVDVIEMGRQYMEIDRLRTKVKKQVDQRASKDRKVRYDVRAKLVNFMAPKEVYTMPSTARDTLFASLFKASV